MNTAGADGAGVDGGEVPSWPFIVWNWVVKGVDDDDYDDDDDDDAMYCPCIDKFAVHGSGGPMSGHPVSNMNQIVRNPQLALHGNLSWTRAGWL